MKRIMKNAVTFLLDTIFPKTCCLCKREGTYLCEDCLSLVPVNNSTFPIPQDSFLEKIYAATPYQNGIIRHIIQNFTYPPFLKDLSIPLAFLIIAHLANVHNKFPTQSSCIVPVPLHPRRLRWRGFNQAEEISKDLSHSLHIPLVLNALERTKSSKPQRELTLEERKTNMQGTLKIKDVSSVQNKNILLVDDFCITGATLEEAAKVLKENGAKEVRGIVVARG